jgi:DNA-binding protein YbaB
MFAGSGADPDDDPEKESQIEQASKAMGFSVKEYKLVLKMQDGLAKAVNELRVTGGSEGKGVQITMDGNSPANHIEFKVTEDGKKLGKATLQKELVAAFKEATDAAKKGQQACIQTMNAEIAEELKIMEGLK